jgi:RES domain-containing protein
MAPSPLAGLTFRAALPDHDDLGRTAKMSRAEPGRFNTPAVGAIYAALDPDTAILELIRSSKRGASESKCALFLVDVALGHVVYLTDPAERERWKLTDSQIRADDVAACQAIVDGVIASGAEAIVWPSAVAGGQSIAIYPDHLANGSRLAIAGCHDIAGDALDAIRTGQPLAQIVPALAPHARR